MLYYGYMATQKKITKCFIASYVHPEQDPVLEKHRISNGLISFTIPNYGVVFRCIGEGDLLTMEFSLFFSLLEFIQTKLKEEKIEAVQVVSSNPQFIFSFSTYSDALKEGTAYRQLLNNYMKKISIQVAYVKPQNNQALSSIADCPSMPKHKTVGLAINKEELSRIEFKAVQKGLKF